MADTSILDLESLLRPISDDAPAGEERPYDLLEAAKEAGRDDDPESMPEDERDRAKVADWSKVVQLTTTGLREHSRHLLLAAYLVNGLVRRNGFAGLAEGLELLIELHKRCWEPGLMWPEVEDGDLDFRAGPLNSLAASDKGMHFPPAIRNVPVVKGKGVAHGIADQPSNQRKVVEPADWDELRKLTPDDMVATNFATLSRCRDLFAEFKPLVEGLYGDSLNSLDEIHRAIEESYRFTKKLSDERGGNAPAGGESDGSAEGDGESGGNGLVASGGGMAMTAFSVPSGGNVKQQREALYRLLEQAGNALQEIEPHSPAPFLVSRAVALGRLPFPKLMRELLKPDAADAILGDLFRELGIKEDKPEEAAGYSAY